MLVGNKTANAVGGKTARACDSCVRKRARWYCAADDAFLCQSCDGSVHSVNQLASRHERVLLESAPSKLFGSGVYSPEPTWHQGLTRRARTPRLRSKLHSFKLEGKKDVVNSSVPLVPELGALEASFFDEEEEEEEEQLLYRVPVFDPFETELCNAANEIGTNLSFIVENKQKQTCNMDDLQCFNFPSDDMELLEFAADVESLLRKGFDNTSCRIDDLGLTTDYKEEDDTNNIGFCFDENRVKVEEAILGFDLDETRGTLDWDFGYDSPMTIKEEDKKVVIGVEEEHMMMVTNDRCDEKVEKSSINLRLNYEDVISAWAGQGSPWTNGTRPQLNSDGCWPDFMGLNWTGSNNPSYGGVGGSDGGREARVSRYREKRRTRLFSKKIRYEVRKLNAEKRPRMKGRFVKRETFGETSANSSFPTYLRKN